MPHRPPQIQTTHQGDVFPVWVTTLQEPGQPEGFALLAAKTEDQARAVFEATVRRDFRNVILSQWTTPQMVSRVYHVGRAGPVFLAMPRSTPIVVDGGDTISPA